MIISVKMTTTQQKMYDLLSDGKWHTLVELHGCLWDEHSNLLTVGSHLSTLRDKIRPHNLHIIRDSRIENGRRVAYYRMELIPD